MICSVRSAICQRAKATATATVAATAHHGVLVARDEACWGAAGWGAVRQAGQVVGSWRTAKKHRPNASGANMNTMGRADRRSASKSGNPGSSQAATSRAGTTVMAPNSHPARFPVPYALGLTCTGASSASETPVTPEPRGP